MLAREYITHCIPPINRSAVNGDITGKVERARGNLYNDVGERRIEDVMELRGWYGAEYRPNLAPCFLANQASVFAEILSCNLTWIRGVIAPRREIISDTETATIARRRLEILAQYYNVRSTISYLRMCLWKRTATNRLDVDNFYESFVREMLAIKPSQLIQSYTRHKSKYRWVSSRVSCEDWLREAEASLVRRFPSTSPTIIVGCSQRLIMLHQYDTLTILSK